MLVLVTGKDGECQTETEAGLQKRQQACRFCSPTGFVNFKNKTAEFKYASCAGASRLEDSVRSWYLNGCTLSPTKRGACDAAAGLRLVNVERSVSW